MNDNRTSRDRKCSKNYLIHMLVKTSAGARSSRGLSHRHCQCTGLRPSSNKYITAYQHPEDQLETHLIQCITIKL